MKAREKHQAGESAADDDAGLFREAMKDVRPLQAPARPVRPRPPPRARFTRADRLAVLAASLADPRDLARNAAEATELQLERPDSGDGLAYRRAEVAPGVLRQLRRGEFRVDDEVDLHGLNAAQAQGRLTTFLALAVSRGDRCVRIIHGKGLRSGARGPVLRNLVDDYLRRVDRVLAFASAREADGGAGATLVLLRPRRAARSPAPRSLRSGR